MKLKEFRTALENNPEYIEAKNDLKLKLDLASVVIKSRTKKGWSQEQLAEKIGTKQANISRIESGLSNPTLSVIQKLVNVLEFSIEIVDNEQKETKFESKPLTLNTIVIYKSSYPQPTPNICSDYEWYKSKSSVEEKVLA